MLNQRPRPITPDLLNAFLKPTAHVLGARPGERVLDMCAAPGSKGVHECYHGQDLNDDEPADESAWRWCGSNFDALGNLRFKSNTFFSPEGLELSSEDLRVWDTHIEDLNWGLTNFDNIGYAAVTIFQSITLEGWSDIMFFCQDGVSIGTASMYFVVMVLFGGRLTSSRTLDGATWALVMPRLALAPGARPGLASALLGAGGGCGDRRIGGPVRVA